nr:hypothetical protein [Tanacetum cinerariifolium]
MATMVKNVIVAGKGNGDMLIDSIENDPFQFKKEITIPTIDGAPELPADIYTLINHYQTAKEIWDRVKEFMKGTELTFKNPEWSRFITAAKQAKDLYNVNFDKLFPFLKHNKKDAKEVREMRQRYLDPLALVANTYNPTPSYNITARKRVKDLEWFKEKMLLAQAQKAGVVLNKHQQDFLADRLEEIEDCDDLQLQTTSNFKADHVDAHDSDYILSEVPHYDTYHEIDILNSVVQETKYSEHFVSKNDSYDELTSDNNVISYDDYMVNIENDAGQYVPSPEQDNAMILFVIEQMKRYALESAVRILNMVPTKKVDRTPYEIWNGKAPNMSYLKVWGYTEEHELKNLNEPPSYKVALSDPKSDKWLDAMNAKMQSMKDNQVWCLVDLPPNGPTVTTIIAFYDYEIWQMDVKPAFLNGRLSEDVYMVQHDGFLDPKHPSKVYKEHRSIYGLKQASSSWNKRYDEEIKKVGFTQNLDEPYLGEVTYILGIKITRDRSKRLIAFSKIAYFNKILKKFRMGDSKCDSVPMQEKPNLSQAQGAKTPSKMRKFIDGLGNVMPNNKRHMEMLCDNIAIIAIANDPEIIKGSRYYQRKYHYIRKVILDGKIVLKKVHTYNNVADPFLKPMSYTKHFEHTMGIGVRPASILM